MKNKTLSLTFLFLIIISCAPNASKLAETNPNILINNADSLIAQRPDDIELRNAIVQAHLNLARANSDPSHYKAVIKRFKPSSDFFIAVSTSGTLLRSQTWILIDLASGVVMLGIWFKGIACP